MSTLDSLPNSARLWVFPLSSVPNETQKSELERRLNQFIGEWKAHGAKVAGGWELRYGVFLVVAADEQVAAVSGCSIDSLYREVKEAIRWAGLGLTDSSRIQVREGEGVRELSREEFKTLAAQGGITASSPVFDNTVATLGELRAGNWERPVSSSWHARLVNIPLI